LALPSLLLLHLIKSPECRLKMAKMERAEWRLENGEWRFQGEQNPLIYFKILLLLQKCYFCKKKMENIFLKTF